MPEVKVNIVYKKEIIRDFYLFHLKVRSKVFWIYFSVLLLLVLTGSFVIAFSRYWYLGTIILILCFIAFVFYPQQIKKLALLKAEATKKREDEVYIFKDKIYKESDMDTVYSYNQVSHVYETTSYLFIYLANKSVLIVSKILNFEVFDELTEILRIHNLVIVKYLNKKII